MTIRQVDGHVEITEEDARSGQTGVHVRYILIVSTALVMLGFGAVALAQLSSLIP